MNIDITFHYPPELMRLLIDTIPALNRSKQDVFLFFRGASVPDALMSGPYNKWLQNKESVNKYDIVREVLSTLNEQGEKRLRERREILKRVVEFENFSVCWEGDQLKARGLIAEIRDVVNVKDSFTRMNIERERERKERIEQEQKEQRAFQKRNEDLDLLYRNISALFALKNPQERGKPLEKALNKLFAACGVGVREAFVLTGEDSNGVVEQIDGVVEIDGHLYFVEMKWWNKPLGVAEVSQHLVRVYLRGEARAIIISASDFTAPSVATCKEALVQKVVVLCTLRELVLLLERRGDLKEFFRRKGRLPS
jgi:restriction system protein